MRSIKTYTELMEYETYEERVQYLLTSNKIGDDTFGSYRQLNQSFYRSKLWLQTRDRVIIRDNGNDLGLEDHPIRGHIIVHHIDPITIEDIINRSSKLVSMNNLISVSESTHRMIHYGQVEKDPYKIYERTPNDTCPWKKNK